MIRRLSISSISSVHCVCDSCEDSTVREPSKITVCCAVAVLEPVTIFCYQFVLLEAFAVLRCLSSLCFVVSYCTHFGLAGRTVSLALFMRDVTVVRLLQAALLCCVGEGVWLFCPPCFLCKVVNGYRVCMKPAEIVWKNRFFSIYRVVIPWFVGVCLADDCCTNDCCVGSGSWLSFFCV